MKKIFALVLVMCTLFTLVACGGNGANNNTESENSGNSNSEVAGTQETEETQKESEDDGKVVYKVTVLGAENAPLAGVYVQVCDDATCFTPTLTNEEGVAEFRLVPADNYKAAISITMPEGYVDCLGQYVTFSAGETELTITLEVAE